MVTKLIFINRPCYFRVSASLLLSYERLVGMVDNRNAESAPEGHYHRSRDCSLVAKIW